MSQSSSTSRSPVHKNCPAAMSPWIGAGSVESRWGTAACSSARRGSTRSAVAGQTGRKLSHRARVSAQMLVAETRARCDNLRPVWPATADLVEPLLAELQAAVPHLDSTDPAPIHGDMAAGQFLWTGHRLVLLDWDMFGYADPAYDVGHFVAQMERRCALDRALPPEAGRWPGCFRDAYLATMPQVSPRNVSFYGALTLLRKTYTVCRRQPAEGPQQAVRLAACARAALEEVRRQ